MSDRPTGLMTLDDRIEIARYEAFRRVRHVRDTICREKDGKKLLTRIMRRLKEIPEVPNV